MNKISTTTVFAIISLLLPSNLIWGQNSSLETKLKNHVEFLASDSLEGRGLGTETMEIAREYIVNQFTEVGISPYNGTYIYPFTFRVGNARVEGKNIIGIIEGSDPELKKELIVLGAHYDHLGYEMKNNKKIIFNGADDNASGTAGIIEIANIIKTNNITLKRSVVFIAFDAEESGLHGSNAIWQNNILDKENTKIMFSLDMIGMYAKNNGLDLIGIESLENSATIIASTLQKKEIKITKSSERTAQRTDTKPFGDRGIPAVHVFTGLKSPYHKPEDDSNLLDYEGMANIVDFTTQLTQEIANYESLTPINKLTDKTLSAKKIEKSKKTIVLGFKTNFGTRHNDYTTEFFKAKRVFAAQTGFYTRLRINKNLALQPEVLYAYGGSNSENGKIKTHSLTIPANIILGFDDNMQGRLFALIGGDYTYNFQAKAGGEEFQFNGDYAQENWGLNFGFGVDVGKIQTSYIYSLGLTNLRPANNDVKIISKGLYLSLGYNF